jgi:hypothetical protein
MIRQVNAVALECSKIGKYFEFGRENAELASEWKRVTVTHRLIGTDRTLVGSFFVDILPGSRGEAIMTSKGGDS